MNATVLRKVGVYERVTAAWLENLRDSKNKKVALCQQTVSKTRVTPQGICSVSCTSS